MKHRLKIAAALVVPSLLVLLAASCSSSNTTSSEPEFSGSLQVTKVDVYGRQVTCITWSGYKKGGLSCDWANAR